MRREVVVGRHLASRRGFLKMTAALAGAGIVNAPIFDEPGGHRPK